MIAYPKDQSLKECVGYVLQKMDRRDEDFGKLTFVYWRLYCDSNLFREDEIEYVDKIIEPYMRDLISRGLFPPKKPFSLKKEGNVIYLYENKDKYFPA